MVNLELAKKSMAENPEGHFYTYSCGRALRSMGISRHAFLLSLKQYKRQFGEPDLLDVYEKHGLHLDNGDHVKTNIIAEICSQTKVGIEALREVVGSQLHVAMHVCRCLIK